MIPFPSLSKASDNVLYTSLGKLSIESVSCIFLDTGNTLLKVLLLILEGYSSDGIFWMCRTEIPCRCCQSWVLDKFDNDLTRIMATREGWIVNDCCDHVLFCVYPVVENEHVKNVVYFLSVCNSLTGFGLLSYRTSYFLTSSCVLLTILLLNKKINSGVRVEQLFFR